MPVHYNFINNLLENEDRIEIEKRKTQQCSSSVHPPINPKLDKINNNVNCIGIHT